MSLPYNAIQYKFIYMAAISWIKTLCLVCVSIRCFGLY